MKTKEPPFWQAATEIIDYMGEEEMSLFYNYVGILSKYKGKLVLGEPQEAFNFRHNGFCTAISTGNEHPNVYILMLCYYDWAMEKEAGSITFLHKIGLAFAICWFIFWVILPLFL